MSVCLANLLCIVPMSTDDPRGESLGTFFSSWGCSDNRLSNLPFKIPLETQ